MENGSSRLVPTGEELYPKLLALLVALTPTGVACIQHSPENFLAYEDFDGTPNIGGRRKSWSPHQKDYVPGNPTWQSGKGSEIIGAINYLSNQGMKSFSFLTMNIIGDDQNVFPYISDLASDRTRFDVSKLAQWEILFEHADSMGMYLHFKTQETTNCWMVVIWGSSANFIIVNSSLDSVTTWP
jgi:hypothetical protein